MLIRLSKDKWALRGHFYSYVDPVWSLYNIRSYCHVIVQVVFWVVPKKVLRCKTVRLVKVLWQNRGVEEAM